MNLKQALFSVIKDKGVFYWTFSLTVYTLLIVYFRVYTSLSTVYHLILLGFPLYVLYKSGKDEIGCRSGNTNQGLFYLGLFSTFVVGGLVFRSQLLGKSLHLASDFSSLALLNIVILAPISEELIHRGYLLPKLSTNTGSPTTGLVLSSAMFSLIHLPKLIFFPNKISFSSAPGFLGNPLYLLFSFFGLGMIFGFVYRETNSVYYPILVHLVINFVLFFLRC